MTRPPGGPEVTVSETSAPLPVPEATSYLSLLVASDEETVRELVRAEATRAGLRVKAAPSASQALSTLDRQQVDLMVVHLATPSLGGVAFVNRLRDEHPETTVVVLPEFVESATARATLAAGPDHAAWRPLA